MLLLKQKQTQNINKIKQSNVYIIKKAIKNMLAPSYRKITRQRQRGLSLSGTSSIKRFNTSMINPTQLNQSFQITQPATHMNIHNNFSSNKKDNKQNLRSGTKVRTQNNEDKFKSYRQQKPHVQGRQSLHYRNRSLLQPVTNYNIIGQRMSESQSYVNSLWQQAESINQMIQLLMEYEKSCQQSMDLVSAEEARRKINELKKQEILTRRKELQVEEKEYALKTRRDGAEEQREFYEFWDEKILEAKQALREIEDKHIGEQRKQLEKFEQCLRQQDSPKVKYSSKVLEIRRNLTQLIKCRKYKQAEHLKSILQKKQIQEQEKWQLQCQDKKIHKIKESKKKQLQELQAFRLKLNSSFNQLIKEKEKQEERMANKMKKMQVEAMKMPSSIVRAKKNLLNESKARIQKDEY